MAGSVITITFVPRLEEMPERTDADKVTSFTCNLRVSLLDKRLIKMECRT